MAKDYTANNILVIAVLHDINLAFNYADRIIFMKSGKIVKTYLTGEEIDKKVVSDVFDVNTEIIKNPYSNKPIFVVNNVSV
jgi:iron complex transport system ATP-binding protein